METSDSEYFESADEDFDSDIEDSGKSSVKLLSVIDNNNKPLEEAICELKVQEPLEKNNKQNTAQFNNNNSSVDKEEKVVKKVFSPIIPSEIATEVLSSSSVCTNQGNIEEKTDDTTIETINDNLWDDNELDWGAEAVKEETNQIEKTTSLNTVETEQLNIGKESEDIQEKESSQLPSSQWEAEWEPLELEKSENPSDLTSWGGWNVTSVLSSATQGVTSISNNLVHLLETAIDIPRPEVLAEMNCSKQQELLLVRENSQQDENVGGGGFALGNFVSGVGRFVEFTGSKVITGGLDTLEAIGKKTVEVLQEGDPGLKKKRALLKLDTITGGKQNLSEVLREAKKQAEQQQIKETSNINQQYQEIRKIKNYETLFDDHHGLVHLEALEMLSKLCTMKLDNIINSLSGNDLNNLQETLEQVKELCELPEEEEEEDEDEKISLEQAKEVISNSVKEINIGISYERLFVIGEESNNWLNNIKIDFIDEIDIHQQGLETLAQITAIAVEQFHKTAELLLVKEHRSTADEADSLVQITTTVKSLILTEAEKFTDKLNLFNTDKINDYITNIFFEAANSATYIQNAFQLLIPVLEVGAV